MKIPKWLQGPVPPGRGELEIDAMVEEALDGGESLDATATARPRPPERWKAFKKTNRRIAEMEEMHEWIRKKADKDETVPNQFLDKLEGVLNDIVS